MTKPPAFYVERVDLLGLVSFRSRWPEPRTGRHVESTAPAAPPSGPGLLLICAPPDPREVCTNTRPTIPAAVLTTPWAVHLLEEHWRERCDDSIDFCLRVPGLVVLLYEGPKTTFMMFENEVRATGHA